MQAVTRLIEIMKRLRDPESGCPWDREQTLLSIVPFTLEEAHELADAIERGDTAGVREELGDLLFHIVFYARIAEESGAFSFGDIAAAAAAKLEARHPHVFGRAAPISSAAEQAAAWERHKAGERSGLRSGDKGRYLDGIPRRVPALTRAFKLQKRAAAVGFDWDRVDGVLDKLAEELDELREALGRGAPAGQLAAELGDILFAGINCARHIGVDPELALRSTNRKFEERFAYMEDELAARGRSLGEASLDEMEAIWQAAKSAMRDRQE